MKKFLSLLLAVVMTLSLVTISAGATEYKDLTDKDELGPQYQEAVAVLNKIGVITGYDDGSFRPDVKLTRGAAAKIIVSLLIGPEAASNLPNNYAPYPDVPSNHTFAGVISFCKTKGIISGYGDGTFKPANDLTGYAFAKMLLGALGYDSATERFTGTGWTQNVLSIGQYASLFDRLDFKGSEAVSRKDAALLALNTLKATVVEYNNPLNISVTGDNTNVVVSGGQVRSYKTSNQEYARNILSHTKQATNDGWFTVEFAEEHFVDLRLTHDKYNPIDDDFGRPSAEWSYKKLSIGTFPLEADYEYTTQVIHNVDTVTDGAKTRALGLSGYSLSKTYTDTTNNRLVTENANLWINGVLQNGNNGTAPELTSVADIANYTDNGTLVQVYVDNNGADFITDVVVVRTQLMEIRKVGSDYVSLDIYDDHSDADGDILYGYNYIPIDVKVNNVEAEDDYYDFLNGLKSGDLVAVVPVAVDHAYNDYDVAEAYTPETATGALTAVETYGSVNTDRNAINITVGGTKYNIALWNKDMREIDSDAVKVTKKDVTLHLDKYGNALLAEDVGSTSDWMIIGNYRQGIQNGILVTYANGWDISGNEVSLNIGARAGISSGTNDVWDTRALPPVGSLVYYTNDTSSNTGEWELGWNGVYTVSDKDSAGDNYEIRTSSSRLSLKAKANGNPVEPGYELPFYKNGVKFIYITLDESGEVDSIEIKKNPQSVTNSEILGNIKFDQRIRQAQACISLNKDGSLKSADNAGVEAVVIKSESSAVSINNLLYISNYKGEAIKDENGNMVQGYVVAMLGEGGKLVATDKVIYSDRTGLRIGTFARYTPSSHDGYEDFYTLRPFAANNAIGTSGNSVAVLNAKIAGTGKNSAFVGANNRMVYLDPATYSNSATTLRASHFYEIEDYHSDADHNLVNEYPSGVKNLVNLRRAQWLDLTETGIDIESATELKDAYSTMVNKNHSDKDYHRDITVTMLFNDNPESDDFRLVYMVVVNSISSGDVLNTGSSSSNQPSTGDVRSTVATNYGTVTGTSTQYAGGKRVDTVTVEAPSWAYFDNDGKVSGALALNGITYVKKNIDNKPYTAVTPYGVALTASAGTLKGEYAGNGKFTVTLNEPLADGDYIEVSSVTWTHAKVQYILNTKDVTNSMTSAKYLEIGQSGTLSSVVYSVADAVAGDYTVTGVEDAANKGGHFTNIKTGDNITGLKALGGEPVVINMTATGAKNQYTVTTEAAISSGVSITGETTAKVSITATPTTVAEGDSVSFEIVLTAPITAVNVESYNVDITLEAADGTKIALPTAEGVTDTHKEYKTWPATTNVEIKAANVKVTPVKAAIRPEKDTITGVGNNNVTIDFIGDCSGVTVDDVFIYRVTAPVTAEAAKGVEKIDSDGDGVKDQLKVVFDAPALADGDVICVDTTSISRITVHAVNGLSASFVQYAVDETSTYFTFQIHKTEGSTTATASYEGVKNADGAKELLPDADPGVEETEKSWVLDLTGVVSSGIDADATIDGVDFDWDSTGNTLASTIEAFKTAYTAATTKNFTTITATTTSITLTGTGNTTPAVSGIKKTTEAVEDKWTAVAALSGDFAENDTFQKEGASDDWTVVADGTSIDPNNDKKVTVTGSKDLVLSDLNVTFDTSSLSSTLSSYSVTTNDGGVNLTITAKSAGAVASENQPTVAILNAIITTNFGSSNTGTKKVEYTLTPVTTGADAGETACAFVAAE